MEVFNIQFRLLVFLREIQTRYRNGPWEKSAEKSLQVRLVKVWTEGKYGNWILGKNLTLYGSTNIGSCILGVLWSFFLEVYEKTG